VAPSLTVARQSATSAGSLTMPRKHLAASQEENAITQPAWEVGCVNQEWAMEKLTHILRCQKGANAIEYALVASLISIAAIVGMNNLGNKITTMFTNISTNLQ
jgi:pilus assembly protein Flp/PilA